MLLVEFQFEFSLKVETCFGSISQQFGKNIVVSEGDRGNLREITRSELVCLNLEDTGVKSV